MHKYGLLSEVRRRKKWQKMSDDKHRYDNLLNREFNADHPNQKWVTDISYIQTKHLSMKELERKFCIAQSTVAGIISRLEQKGFSKEEKETFNRLLARAAENMRWEPASIGGPLFQYNDSTLSEQEMEY